MFKVSLQFPEGLLLFATLIADIITKFCKSEANDDIEALILGDVTYGACCVDDLASKALDCDFIVHYGHSCLVPIQDLSIKNALYVFVEIQIDINHFIETIAFNFKPQDSIYLMGTIQFNKTIFIAKTQLEKEPYNFTNIKIPQTKPRSGGEVLGCTSPALPQSPDFQKEQVVFISDGRFHIESTMIKNPHMHFYQYNPYSKLMTEEVYIHEQMHKIRRSEVEKAKKANNFGIIFGTLGRQGNQGLLSDIQNLLKKNGKTYFVLFLSEISIDKLKKFPQIEAWVQIACPRLSVDWGHFFDKPLLNTYEAHTAMMEIEWQDIYPMDYYSYDGGKWSNYYKQEEERKLRLAQRKSQKSTSAVDGSTRDSPARDSKKNQSVFKQGFIIDAANRSSKMVFINKSDSDIFFERVTPLSQTPRPESSNYGSDQRNHSKQISNKRYSIAPQSISQSRGRNPLIGSTLPQSDSVSRKKLVDFKPSQTLSNLNMKKYLLSSDMKTLDELKQSKKYSVIQENMQSNIFNSTTSISNNFTGISSQKQKSGLPPKSPAKGKLRLQQQSVMNDVLSYKGIPGFKEEYVERKINQEKHSFVLQKTLQSIIEDNNRTKMTKNLEMKSQIF
eukprot:403367655